MGWIYFIICIFLFSPFSLYAKNLVKVGDTVITSDDLIKRRDLLNRTIPVTAVLKDKYLLDTIVLYHLALKDAHAKKMEADPEAQQAMETALFNYYLYKTVDEKIAIMNVSEAELREQYKKDPVLTFKRLVMPVNPKTASSVKAKLSLYRTDLNNGKASFDDVMNKIGKNELSSLSGLFSKVNAYSLPEAERQAMLRMQPGELSPVIDMAAFVEILQLVKKYPYAEVNAQRILDSYKRDKLTEERLKIIEDLKTKYNSIIHYY